MNRGFDIFRNAANGVDPNNGTAREDEMRARRFRHEEGPFEHRFHAADYDHDHDYWHGGRPGMRGSVPPAPPTTYGVTPYEQRMGQGDPREVWRGRDEQHDFWGADRHSHHPHAHHDPNHPSMWERVKGVFHGKGPKNYVRSDERIREDVCEHLSFHPYIDASDIEVSVKEGEVTLAGTVDTRGVKRAAEDCCEHVRGVKDVHNQLRVQRGGEPAASGATRPAGQEPAR